MSQQLIMEAESDAFNINDKYYNALPRPTYDQSRALEINLIQRGQLEPIKVNRKMTILNGHSRYDLLANRGIRIKYEFRDFANDEEEYIYVVETNVMKRDLNTYQRVETMYSMYKTMRLERREKDLTSHYDMLYCLKEGYNTVTNLVHATGYSRRHVQRALNGLVEDYSVSRKKLEGEKHYEYEILPRAESMLTKAKSRSVGGLNVLVGKTVGVNRNAVTQAVAIIEKGSEEVKRMCREGTIGVGKGYEMLIGRYIPSGGVFWRANSKIQCPHCNHISRKHEYKLL